jgi:hypothetical protein
MPLLNINKKDGIQAVNRIEKNNFNIEITYWNRGGLPFNDLYNIDKNYYIKSLHAFVFCKPIDCDGTMRRIFEVPSDLAEELEHNFEYRLRMADPFHKFYKWVMSLF